MPQGKESLDRWSGLEWRCIGPFRGGRVVAVSGDPTNPAVFYFGAVAGGVWKTVDGGMYWENVSDGYFNTSSIGALAVSEADPNVIYAGTGETTIRIDVSHGDGVYKTTDAGKTWKHVGLEDTRHIGKIAIHPQNPEIVYVAALGHAFGNNKQRGVFRSTNGGKTWDHVLFKSEKAGAVDIKIDPRNPRILYAAIWETYRNFWDISSGGPESGIHKTTDGGDTWVDITTNPGLPKGPLGKIGIAASPAKSGRVWALVEAKEGQGLYRSDDYGDHWELVSDHEGLTGRSWYYMHIVADPQDAETVYVMCFSMWKSIDGGRNFTEMTTPHGDNHDLWIAPNDNRRMIEGNDGGACVSFNSGESWSTLYNQPTAQFYHLATDNQFPYRVYGTQQDNTSISVPSRSDHGAIMWADCYPAGTGESGYITVHPEDSNIVYVGAVGSSPGGGGALQRYDHRSQQIRLITVWPETMSGWGAKDYKYRFHWTFPIVFSPHDPNILYATGNIAFRTRDEGKTWEPISPDLTRNDATKLVPTGGPVNKDAIGAETYATIFAFIESQHEKGVFWAGSDDGLIHISRDGGKNWTDVTPKDLPEWSMISIIEQSPHDPATVYVAATRYKLDDYQPYLYKTSNYGKTWVKITKGIPDNDFTRVIREDPNRRGLLYAGTETGLYISFDDGASWEKFQINLPVSPIHDMLIKDNDLIVATHGRSFWILDDITPLHQLNDKIAKASAHLFKPRDTVRVLPKIFEDFLGGSPGKNYSPMLGLVAPFTEAKSEENQVTRKFLDAGQNPPSGVLIRYLLKDKPQEQITLTILDAEGNEIKTFTSKPIEEAKKPDKEEHPHKPPEVFIGAKAGMNRFVWDMRYPHGVALDGPKDQSASLVPGPIAPPGRYQVRLTVGKKSFTEEFEILKDPRATASEATLKEQFDLLMKIRDKHSEANTAINRMRNLRKQLDEWTARVKGQPNADEISKAAENLKEKLTKIEEVLIMPGLKRGWEVTNTGVRVAAKLAGLPAVVAAGDYEPTTQAYEVFKHLGGQIDEQVRQLDALIKKELPKFNDLIRKNAYDAVIPLA